MQIPTRDFGTVEIREEDILTFLQPIYGFEDYTHFVPLYDETVGKSLMWLQSTEEPQLCFLLIDPDALPVSYAPQLDGDALRLLGSEELECWCIATVASRFEDSTVNLKSPVLINSVRGTAAQVICTGTEPIRCPLSGRKKEDAPC